MVLRKFQECLMKGLRMFHESFKVISWYFREAPGVFLKCFNDVSRVFQGSFACGMSVGIAVGHCSGS